MAQNSREIIQKLDIEQRASLKNSLVSSGRSGHQILQVLSLKVTNSPFQNQFQILKNPCGLFLEENF